MIRSKCFRDNINDEQKTVLQFLAGLSPKAYETNLAESDVTSHVMKLKWEMICMLFEAKLHLSDRHVTVDDKGDYYEHAYMHTMYMLGSIIAHSSHTCCWDIFICAYNDGIQMFERGIGSGIIKSKLRTLRLHITRDYHNPRLPKLDCTIDHLHLKYSAEMYNNASTAFSDKFWNIEIHIKHLQLTSFNFDSTESRKIESYLKHTPSITCLTLESCAFYTDILPGVEACNNVEKLCIHTSDESEHPSNECSWESVYEMLKKNKSLKEFQIVCDIYRLSEFTSNFMNTNTIRKLSMRCNNKWSWWSRCDCIDFELCKCDEDLKLYSSLWQNFTTEIAEVIKESKTLTELNIKVPGCACIGIAKAMCENNTLQKLIIDVGTNYSMGDLEEGGAEAFASMLRGNTTLTEFCLSQFHTSSVDHDKWITDFNILTSSLSHNNTLSKLQIIYPNKFLPQECHEAISAECAKDSRLVFCDHEA